MGGRYGANNDGSSEYQERRPDQSERKPEQQTVAEAVRSVTQQQQTADDVDSTRTQSTSDRPTDQQTIADAGRSASDSTQRRPQLGGTRGVDQLVSTMTDADDSVADVIAENLTDLIRRANEEPLPDDETTR